KRGVFEEVLLCRRLNRELLWGRGGRGRNQNPVGFVFHAVPPFRKCMRAHRIFPFIVRFTEPLPPMTVRAIRGANKCRTNKRRGRGPDAKPLPGAGGASRDGSLDLRQE